jgi:L-threonylcarbamoyladenylate synthase
MISTKEAVRVMRNGGVVTYPTESFYALGTDATNEHAVKKIFRLKGRGKKPIALVASDFKQVRKFFHISPAELKLAKKYWPGPLTLLLRPKAFTTPNPSFPRQARDGLGRRGVVAVRALAPATPLGPPLDKGGRIGRSRIGIRVPAHALARRLAAATGVPLTATSANLSGMSPTKSRSRVKKVFLELPVVHGSCGRQQLPSAVVELFGNKLRLHRQGAGRM